MAMRETGLACRAAAPPQPRPAPEPPRSLSALAASGAALTVWEADAETLQLVLPVFGKVAATTVGRFALLSERGGYGPVRLAGQAPAGRPLAGPKGRIGLRLLSGRGERLVMSAADPAHRQPAGLHLFDADGQLMHRTEIAAPEDMLLLASLSAELGAGPLAELPAEAEGKAPPLPSIPEIRRLQSEWQSMDAGAHLDDILLDGGQERLCCLRHLGTRLARPVPAERLGPFLLHLAKTRLAFSRILARPGCIQSHSGAAEVIHDGQGPLVMRSKASVFALDLAGVAQAWLTEWQLPAGPSAVVELYDDAGTCLALLAGRDMSAKEITLWNRLAALLPET